MIPRVFALIVLLSLLVNILSCGQASSTDTSPKLQQEALSTSELDSEEALPPIRQYAEWCGEHNRNSSIDSITTWGEATEHFRKLHADYVEAKLPPEVDEYHRAQTRALAAMYAFGKNQDPDEPFSLFGLLAPALIIGNEVEDAEENLSASVRRELSMTGCLGDGEPGGWHYTQYEDPITDEVRVYFTLKSESKDYGYIVVSADCTGEFLRLFLDINVISLNGGTQNLEIRFQDEEHFSELWEWVEEPNAPEHITESLLVPPSQKRSRYVDRLLANEKLAIRYPGNLRVSIRESTLVFFPDGLSSLMEEKIRFVCQ